MAVQDYLQARDAFVSEALGWNAILSVLHGNISNLRNNPADSVVLNTEIAFDPVKVQWARTRINGQNWLSAPRLARLLLEYQTKRAAMHQAWEKLTPELRAGLPKPCDDAGM